MHDKVAFFEITQKFLIYIVIILLSEHSSYLLWQQINPLLSCDCKD